MSMFCRRIHVIFISPFSLSFLRPHFSSRTYTSATLDPLTKSEEPAKLSIPQVFNESDLRMMVNKFKLFSRDKVFRKRVTVYTDVVQCLTVAKKFSWIEEILEDQKQYMPFDTHEGFVPGIISLYGNSGMFENARKLFDEVPELNCNHTLKSFNALLEACVRSDHLDKLEEIFREIPPKLSLTPNTFSYTILIKGYLKMGSLDSILFAVKEMEEKGLKPDSATYGLLLDGLYQNGRVSESDEVWGLMKREGIEPCIRCYNSKLRFLVSQNNMKEALDLFRSLKRLGLKPGCLTFCALFEEFRGQLNLADAKRLFKKIPSKGFRGSLIFEILVPFATEMRDFGFALELCRAAIRTSTMLDEAMLQGVVDGLVEESKLEEAKTLIDSIRQLQWFISTLVN